MDSRTQPDQPEPDHLPPEEPKDQAVESGLSFLENLLSNLRRPDTENSNRILSEAEALASQHKFMDAFDKYGEYLASQLRQEDGLCLRNEAQETGSDFKLIPSFSSAQRLELEASSISDILDMKNIEYTAWRMHYVFFSSIRRVYSTAFGYQREVFAGLLKQSVTHPARWKAMRALADWHRLGFSDISQSHGTPLSWNGPQFNPHIQLSEMYKLLFESRFINTTACQEKNPENDLLYNWAQGCTFSAFVNDPLQDSMFHIPDGDDSSQDALHSKVTASQAEASRLYRLAADAYLSTLGPHHPRTIDCLWDLGTTLFEKEDYIQAQNVFQQIYEIQQKNVGNRHPEVHKNLAALAYQLWRQGKFVEAGKYIWQIPHQNSEAKELDRVWTNYRFSSFGQLNRNLQLYSFGIFKSLDLYGLPTSPRFRWDSEELYCLPIQTVRLQPVQCSDDEKLRCWHPSLVFESQRIILWSSGDDTANAHVYFDGDSKNISVPITNKSTDRFFSSSVSDKQELLHQAQKRLYVEEARKRKGSADKSEWEIIPSENGRFWIKELSRASDKFKYRSSITKGDFLDIEVPYISYETFQQSKDFQAGLPYRWYVRIAWKSLGPHHAVAFGMDRRLHPIKSTPEAAGIAKCPPIEMKLPTWSPLIAKPNSIELRNGFFNGIPCDTVAIHDDGNVKFNLVSSRWAEWQHFTVHKMTEGEKLQLTAAAGSPLTQCRGYITGTFTDFKVERQYGGLMVFVVDAEILFSGENKFCNFLIKEADLQLMEKQPMTPYEKRSFCAALNPTLYNYRKELEEYFGGGYSRSKFEPVQVKRPTKGSVLAEEMNRRDAWDREFESNIPNNDEERLAKEQELEAESQCRRAWDQQSENEKLAKAQAEFDRAKVDRVVKTKK